jgi:hypothetical protein
MQLAVANFGYDAGGWRVERHPRFLADLTGDGCDDIVGFGYAGVWVSLNNGDGTFGAPQLAVGNFGFDAGGWRVQRHPRMLADLTGDGRADIVGFGDAGVWVSLNNGDGTFGAPQLVVANFAYNAGGWRVERHPRFLADLTGDGCADIVGFGYAGVWVSFNNGDGTFGAPQLVVGNFGYDAGGWRVERHPRMLADLTGDGRADIVGFGDAGVWVSLNNGSGAFAAPQNVVANFAFSAGGWRVQRHPRMLADLTGDGRADIVGFGDAGVWASLNNGSGGFAAPQNVVANFAYNAGGWRVERHPRFLADLTGDGRSDIVGFGNAGVWVSLNDGSGAFGGPELVIRNFGYDAGGWRVERHPRFVADLNGDGAADIAGCGYAGVWVSLNNGDGSFATAYVRKNIWGLEATTPWDPVTLAYANAVKAMQARPATDPTSWTYQAAVHGTSAAVPAGAVWNECQHGSWFFLSWHRMYLHYFERIVRAEVVNQGGPSDWALPFWDYEQPGQAALPPAFRELTMPDGSANPLRVTQRGFGMNSGALLPPSVTSSSSAMGFTSFLPPPGQGFGGGQTAPQHFFGLGGELEFDPHNAVHGTMGGWMGNANLAAQDPIFWLHHANIDRLWEKWLAQGGGRANPGEAQWRDTPFTFHDESGTQLQLTGDGVVDIRGQLGYTYEGVAEAALVGEEEAAVVSAGSSDEEPELVGSSERPVELAGEPTSVEVALDRRAVETRAAGAESAAPGRVYLNVEDVEAERNPDTAYEVFIAVASPGEAPVAPRYVGNVSFFGIEHLSKGGRTEEGPHGFRRTFDITGAVEELRAQGAWDETRLTVSFRPVWPILPPTAEEAAEAIDPEVAAARAAPVRIGRVSLFYA